MLLVHSDEVSAEKSVEVELKSLIGSDVIPEGRTVLGTVSIPPGIRFPMQGSGVHEQDEYSYIVKGSLLMGTGETEYRVNTGDATLIPAGEAHWVYNDGNEEVLVIWTLVSRG